MVLSYTEDCAWTFILYTFIIWSYNMRASHERVKYRRNKQTKRRRKLISNKLFSFDTVIYILLFFCCQSLNIHSISYKKEDKTLSSRNIITSIIYSWTRDAFFSSFDKFKSPHRFAYNLKDRLRAHTYLYLVISSYTDKFISLTHYRDSQFKSATKQLSIWWHESNPASWQKINYKSYYELISA